MTLLIAVAAIVAAVPLALTGVLRARTVTAEQRDAIRFLGADGFVPVRRRVLSPTGRVAASLARRITPKGHIESLRERIERAGSTRSVENVLAAKGAGLAGGVLVGLWGGWAMLMLAPAIGFFAPDVMLRRRGVSRGEMIRLALPDALDLMAILVEAGVGIEAAMARVAEDADGPLGDEFRRMLHEMSLGASRHTTFAALRERVDCTELSRFVLAILQADRLGTPIGVALHQQAVEMRSRRRQTAKERAAKTPVKILFPLVFGIFPALLVVILGPAALRIMQTVFSG